MGRGGVWGAEEGRGCGCGCGWMVVVAVGGGREGLGRRPQAACQSLNAGLLLKPRVSGATRAAAASWLLPSKPLTPPPASASRPPRPAPLSSAPLRRPTVQQISKRMLEIAGKEGLAVNQATMDALVQSASGGDIRLILGQLQMVRLRARALSYDQVKGGANMATAKDLELSPFEAAKRLLEGDGLSLRCGGAGGGAAGGWGAETWVGWLGKGRGPAAT